MLILTGLFGCLLLISAENRRRTVAVLLIGCIAILGVAPPPAYSQFCLPCIIQTVLTTISQTLANWLSLINGVISDIRNFYQKTIWPVDVINQLKGQVRSIIAQFRGVIQSIMSINPHTAKLPNPASLEAIIRNRGTGDVASLSRIYLNTFQPVPSANNMAPEDRDMTDMDDALAQDNLVLSKQADQAQDLQLQLADQVETIVSDPSIKVSAPGTSSLITAAAAAAEIKSQAIMQKMLAGLLRQEAGRIAHENQVRKRNAAIAIRVQTNIQNLLQHK